MALRYPVPAIVPTDSRPHPPPPRRRLVGWVRVTIPGVVGCFLLCMFGKAFVGDTFVLRTSSMEPTVVGRKSGGDRVVLSRLHTMLQEPERFDILLFQYPNNRATHYMKRLVGLPGEQLFIRGGDLWIGDAGWSGTLEDGVAQGRVTVIRKPPRVRDGLVRRLPVLHEDELSDFDSELFRRHCEVAEGGNTNWTPSDDHVRVTSQELSLVRLRREARDLLYDVVHPGNRNRPPTSVAGGKHQCGDLSFQLEARPEPGTECVVVEIVDTQANRRIRAEIAIEGGAGRTTLWIDHTRVGSCTDRLSTNSWTTVLFENVDDHIRLAFDGNEVMARDYGHQPATNGNEGQAPPSEVRFGIRSGEAQLRPLSLHRDIYYVAEGQTRFIIPNGHYILLGDNSASSADSRSWRRVAIRVARTGEVLHGDAQGVTPTSILLHDRNPWPEPDGTWTFADCIGNLHEFSAPHEWSEVGTWPTPYVKREWIIGRGMCVVAPMTRFSWLR